MSKSSKRTRGTAPAGGRKLPKPVHPPAFNWKVLLQALVIAAVGFWVFSPAPHGDFGGDDTLYLSGNPLRNDPLQLWKTWFAPGSFIEYYPITETVQMIQWHFWRTESFGYVLTNVILHIVNALLVWRLLGKLGLRYAWLGGLLFLVHPLTVESVAWISELKNTLSLAPFLLAMGAWIDYEENKNARDYWLALGLFGIAMLCKITMSPFPVVILLYAWWKRGRVVWGDLRASLPFFVISLVLGLTTQFAGESFASRYPSPPLEIPISGFLSHLALGGLSSSFYFSKFFWPWKPSPMYVQWRVDPQSLWQFLPWPVFAGVIYLCWKKRRSWGRHVLLGLGYFFLFLAPFVGFIPISYMMFTWAMDHFLYLPMIGLIGLIVAGLDHAAGQMPRAFRSWGAGAAAIVIFLLALESHSYAKNFASQEALYSYAVRFNPGCPLARENLGRALLKRGDIAGAKDQFEAALQLDPRYVDGHFDLGTTLMESNRLPEAVAQFDEAIRLDPRDADAYDNLGATLMQLGRTSEAMDYFRQAIAISNFAQPHNDLGNALVQQGKVDEAISEYQKALAIDPEVAAVHENLGVALLKEKRVPEAIQQFEIAAKIDPEDEIARAALKDL
ncbi:MAG: tetratricopeptide repeat protein [Methylacidiphilales bacterium]|nr:tetratricopeptide repeat protein [Candidatus Methylacidiphilales bacterium]